MWGQYLLREDSITESAGVALIFSLLVEYFSSGESEVVSEIFCWILVPRLFVLWETGSISAHIPKPVHEAAGSRISLWIVAGGISIACVYRSEIGREGLFPFLTTCLLVAERCTQSEVHVSKALDSWKSVLTKPISASIFVAVIAVFAVSEYTIQDYALSLIPVLALLLVYVAFRRKSPRIISFLPLVDLEAVISTLALHVVVILLVVLGIQLFAFGIPIHEAMHMLPLGLSKALAWFFTIKTVTSPVSTGYRLGGTSPDLKSKHLSWTIATTIRVFSMVSSINVSTQPSESKAVSQVIASCLLLSQMVHLLPGQAKAKYLLLGFSLFTILPYLNNMLAIQDAILSTPSNVDHAWEHPVEILFQNAKTDFEHRMSSQSKDYTSASTEYQRRYNVQPPPGFKAWYDFAVTHQSSIIDDFDMIHEMISPFWRLSGKEIVQIINEAENTPGIDLWSCKYSAATTKTSCTHPTRSFDRHIESMFNGLLGNISGILPDVKFLVNHLDEPRVILPPSTSRNENEFTMTDLSSQPSWDLITKHCLQQNSSKSIQQSVETYSLSFVTNRSEAIDLCQHPEYVNMHGLFMSPTSMKLIEGLVPVLSTGAPSTLGDILLPSPAYMEPEFRYDPQHDIPWEDKQNRLYWAGSTTGGFANDEHWRSFHRQRFVEIAQNLKKKNSYLRSRDRVVAKENSSFLNGRLYNTFFTRIFQCTPSTCRSQRSYFRTHTWAHPDAFASSTLAFDTDGNGISGRFYKVLSSNSLPLKQTIFKEWHDERLVPWVHYVPVSLSMEELPELVFWFTSTESGRKMAEEIASEGKEWWQRAGRDVDRSIYVLRLLLELARLQDPERQASLERNA